MSEIAVVSFLLLAIFVVGMFLAQIVADKRLRKIEDRLKKLEDERRHG